MRMIGLGTIVNVGAIILGTILGLLLKKGLPEKIKTTVMKALGLATIFIGIIGVLTAVIKVDGDTIKSNYLMLIILSLAIGGVIGEWIDIEARLERFGLWCRRVFRSKDDGESRFVEGFVAASLLFCVGAMAIIGSLEDGLTGNATTLYAKSALDGISSIILSATAGIGVLFSAITVGVYQGGITLGAGFFGQYMSRELITQMSAVGSVLIFAIGLNMTIGKKIKVGNLIPAVLVPVIYDLILSLIGK